MSLGGLAVLLGLVLVSFGIAVLALAATARFDVRVRSRAAETTHEPKQEDGVVFLFDGESLVDATPQARALLQGHPASAGLGEFLQTVGARFPDLEEAIHDAPSEGTRQITSADAAAVLTVEADGGLLRITIAEIENQTIAVSRLEHESIKRELESLQAVSENAAFLVWAESETRQITWANRAYLDLVRASDSNNHQVPFPIPRLFDPADSREARGPDRPVRASLRLPGEPRVRWFECHRTFARGNEVVYTAVPVDSAVAAETELRQFSQTLAKTFSALPIGLAIFDADLRLAVFNPALSDLTTLDPAALSARPQLSQVLDSLRDRSMIPEPKDYKAWRRRVQQIEATASGSQYREDWSLPAGKTYRVTGQRHPGGGLALLIEDISEETRINRQHRMQVETRDSVLDAMSEAIVVFSRSGLHVLDNKAYRELWGLDEDDRTRPRSVVEATIRWNERCFPSPIWADLRDFVRRAGERANWKTDVRHRDGRRLECRVTPIAGGATMISFRPSPDTPKLAATEAGQQARLAIQPG